jgi:hypothetical protein
MKEYFLDQLESLLEQTITIYTISSNQQHKLSGVLIGIQEDYITLVIKTGESVPVPQTRPFINFNRAINKNNAQILIPGIIAQIPLHTITTVLHYAL